jgi:hypothetical protein
MAQHNAKLLHSESFSSKYLAAPSDYLLDAGPVEILSRIPLIPHYTDEFPVFGQAVGPYLLLLVRKGYALL